MKNFSFKQYFHLSRLLGLTAKNETILLGLIVSATFFESIGLAMFLPIAEFIQSNGDVAGLQENSKFWAGLVAFFDFLHVSITLPVLILSSFFFILVRQFFSYHRQLYFQRVFHRMTQQTRCKLFEAYLNADATYHDKERTGGVVNSMTTELTLAIQAITSPIMMLSYVLIILFYLVLLSLITGPIAVAAIGVMGVSGFCLKRFLDKTASSGGDVADANQSMSAFLVQRLGAIRLIRLSGMEAAEKTEMERLTVAQRNYMISIYKFLTRVDVLMEPITLGISLAVLFIGVTYLDLKLEEIAVFAVLAMVRLLPAIKELLSTAQAALGYHGSLMSFKSRLESAMEAKEQFDGITAYTHLRDRIEFRATSFSYPMSQSARAIKSIDLSIPANKMTAIVGPSGAGKSTLIDLLPRLRMPTGGDILLDGIPIQELEIASLREGIAYVSQQPLVFNVTAAEHIAYGNPDANRDQILAAAKLADADAFITKLPDGYDTMVGERGVRLSGGQLQRLDLARALVREATILILDEPTSNLDAQSEAEFRRTLQKVRTNTNATIIVIAHRLSTVMDADHLVVLRDGKVEAVGTHKTVLKANAWYREAFKEQSISTHSAATNETPKLV